MNAPQINRFIFYLFMHFFTSSFRSHAARSVLELITQFFFHSIHTCSARRTCSVERSINGVYGGKRSFIGFDSECKSDTLACYRIYWTARTCCACSFIIVQDRLENVTCFPYVWSNRFRMCVTYWREGNVFWANSNLLVDWKSFVICVVVIFCHFVA